jgi:hypothetical protein
MSRMTNGIVRRTQRPALFFFSNRVLPHFAFARHRLVDPIPYAFASSRHQCEAPLGYIFGSCDNLMSVLGSRNRKSYFWEPVVNKLPHYAQLVGW